MTCLQIDGWDDTVGMFAILQATLVLNIRIGNAESLVSIGLHPGGTELQSQSVSYPVIGGKADLRPGTAPAITLSLGRAPRSQALLVAASGSWLSKPGETNTYEVVGYVESDIPQVAYPLTSRSPESDHRTSVFRPVRRLRPHRLLKQRVSDRKAAVFLLGGAVFQRSG